MSMRADSVSSAARRRIRTFSIWLWVWGAVVLAIGAFGTFTNVGFGGNGLGIIGANGNPWDDADPTVFEPVGTTYSGDGSGVIRIPLEEHNQEAYAVTLVTGDYVDLYVTPASDINQPATDRSYPNTIAYIYGPDDVALVLPEEADLELWVRSDDAWEFTLEKAEFTEITDGFASGSGNGYLVYRGDAVSARFVHRGDGLFFVTIQTVGGQSDRPIIESGEIDLRESWDPTSAVYFSIESDDDRGAWTVDIDELAGDAPTDTPSPADVQPDATVTDPAASIESTLR